MTNEPITLRASLIAIFTDALAPTATDSTIDDCIADLLELAAADIIDDATADDLALALHRIADIDDTALDAIAFS